LLLRLARRILEKSDAAGNLQGLTLGL